MAFLPGAGLVMILVGVASYYATRSLAGLSGFSLANLVLGSLLLALGGVAALRRFRGFSGAESRRAALRALGGFSLAVSAAVGIQLAAGASGARLDLTVERMYTLSEQTLGLCREFDAGAAQPLELVFFEDALLAKDVKLLVSAYGAGCPALRVRDASRDDPPPEARELYRTTATTVIACRGPVCDPVGYPSERNITQALLRLQTRHPIRVYFLVGHGEIDLASQAESGYSGLAALLRDQGFEVSALVGPAASDVPADAEVLIAGAPERDLLPAELAALERWLAGGGRLLALAEPGLDTNLYRELLPRFGFELPDGIVLDDASSPLLEEQRAQNLLVHLFDPRHPVTRNLSQRTMVLLPGTRPIALGRKPDGDDRLEQVAFASQRAWVERDVAAALSGRGSVRPAGADAAPAPVVAAGAYPRGEREARVVVVGDRDFASNRLLEALYNRDLVLNAVRWLAADEAHIAIGDKGWTPNQDPLTLQQTVAYFYFLAFALPEALLLLGIYAWYRQRA